MGTARMTKKTGATLTTKRWDWSTKGGRDELDAAVLGAVVAGCRRRAEVAKWLGVGDSDRALRAVGQGLVRGAARGELFQHGEGGQRVYEATFKGHALAAKEGGGK